MKKKKKKLSANGVVSPPPLRPTPHSVRLAIHVGYHRIYRNCVRKSPARDCQPTMTIIIIMEWKKIKQDTHTLSDTQWAARHMHGLGHSEYNECLLFGRWNMWNAAYKNAERKMVNWTIVSSRHQPTVDEKLRPCVWVTVCSLAPNWTARNTRTPSSNLIHIICKFVSGETAYICSTYCYTTFSPLTHTHARMLHVCMFI